MINEMIIYDDGGTEGGDNIQSICATKQNRWKKAQNVDKKIKQIILE